MKQDKLEEEFFKLKFETLYQGIKTGSFRSLCYYGVFAVRRFNIVLINLYFTKDSPMSGVDRSNYLFKIIGFIAIQTGYMFFIHTVLPHNDSIYNMLEIVNEYSMILLAYLSLNFVNMVQLWNQETKAPMKQSIELNSYIEYVGIGIVLLTICLNFTVMIRLSIGKLIAKCR